MVKGGSVSSIHPPLDNLTFLLEDVALNATPFCTGREGDMAATCADVQKVHQQLNYTSTAISTIATQLNQVATRLDTPGQTTSSSKNIDTYANSISKPFFKVEGVSRKDHDKFTTAFSNASLLNQISKQIKALELQTPSTSCIDKTCSQIQQDTSSETEEADTDDSESGEEATINVITKTFEDEQALALNKINYGNKSTIRNYYSRPSPPDLQYEE